MILKPITLDEDKSKTIYANAGCQEVFKSYPDYYKTVGYEPPWISYFVIRDEEVVGVCSFTGKPVDGRVEVAYMTFAQYEGQGIASFACQHLTGIALRTDPELIITAKTLPEKNASTKILKSNGFHFSKVVQDEDIGDAWEWIHNPDSEAGVQ